MMTKHERQAAYIAALKYGIDEFAQIVGTDRNRLLRVLRGEYNPIVEDGIKRNWQLVLSLLHGDSKKGDSKSVRDTMANKMLTGWVTK